MQLKLTARHDNPSEATRQYAEAKLSKLDRRLHDLTLIEVTFSREHNPSIANDHTVEAIVHAKGPNLVARESAPTYEAAIDRLLDKLERQVERYRDKRTVEMRRARRTGTPPRRSRIPIDRPGGVPARRRRSRRAESTAAQRISPRWLYACGWLPSPRSVNGSYCSGSSPVGPAVSSICWNSSSASPRRPVRR